MGGVGRGRGGGWRAIYFIDVTRYTPVFTFLGFARRKNGVIRNKIQISAVTAICKARYTGHFFGSKGRGEGGLLLIMHARIMLSLNWSRMGGGRFGHKTVTQYPYFFFRTLRVGLQVGKRGVFFVGVGIGVKPYVSKNTRCDVGNC